MKKNFKKWLCVALAVLVILPAVSLIAGALAPSIETAPSVQVPSDSPLKVEITSDKEEYSLFNKIVLIATITNTSSNTMNNISAEVSFSRFIRGLKKNSETTVEKNSLAPGESFQMRFYVQPYPTSITGIDVLVFPLIWLSSVFRGGMLPQTSDNGLYDGRTYTNARLNFDMHGLSDFVYDASVTVGVRYGGSQPYEPPAFDDKSGVWHRVIDRIDDITKAAKYTGKYSHDIALAQNTYEEIMSFLEEEEKQGYVKSYSVNESGISYKLSTGLVGGLFWENIYDPARFEEIQTEEISLSLSTTQDLPTVVNNQTLNIAILQPRYSSPYDGNKFKTSIFSNKAKKSQTRITIINLLQIQMTLLPLI